MKRRAKLYLPIEQFGDIEVGESPSSSFLANMDGDEDIDRNDTILDKGI